MQWVEFERLSLHAKPLSPSDQVRFEQLERRDDEMGRRLAPWLVVGIFAGWSSLLALAFLLSGLSRL